MPSIRVLLLGTPSVERDGVALQVARRKAFALLAYLTVAGEPCRREALAALLWPDNGEAEAHAYLRNALWVLKGKLGEEWVDTGRETAGLAPHRGLWVDVAQFQRLLGSCAEHGHSPHEVCPACLAPLAQAVDLYRGDFLAGFSLSDSEAFDEWQLLRAESLRHEAARALQQLVRCLSAQGQVERSIPYARRWLALDPLNEDALRQMMCCYAWAGQTVAALKQYREGARLLNEELGLKLSAETTSLYEAIKAKESIPLPILAPGPAVPPKTGPPPAAQAKLSMPPALPASSPSAAFVGRGAEMSKLRAALDKTYAGTGQIVFITGETGTGKTALAREFARLAQEADAEILVATGSCDPHTGLGDPYLPFREVLNLVAGDVESRGMEGAISPENARRLQAFGPTALSVMVDLGPDLLALMAGPALQVQARLLAPGIVERMERSPATGTEDLTQQGTSRPMALPNRSRFFAEYANVVQGLARRRPLLLILDDLHWADASSISLLSHLGRRIQEDRVLIVGTYRPEDVHPATAGPDNSLQSLVGEFKGRFGDICVDLDDPDPVEARRFVDALVDREPNHLGQEFRQHLYRHTGGQPLFATELLRHLQQHSGTLQRDGTGRWVEVRAPDWDRLPARVEGIIEKRVSRLAPELRRMLRLASVQGEEFTAEVLAEVLRSGERETIRRLSDELDREHRLVSAQGLSRVNGRRLSQYRFRHTLFQRYLYAGIGEAERAYLHEDVGKALENLYGNQAPSIAVQLARHFEAAGSLEKAFEYLLLAGNQARQVSANEEAIVHLTCALDLLATLPATPERTRQELVALTNLGSALIATRGYADPEVGRVYRRAHDLAAPLNIPQLFPAMNGLLQFYRLRGELHVADELGERLLAQAQVSGDPGRLAEAHRSCGITAMYLGQPGRAHEHFDKLVGSYGNVDRPAHVQVYGDDPWVNGMSYQSWVLWLLGYPDQAAEQGRKALSLAHDMANLSPFGLTQALVLAAVLQNFRRDVRAAAESADAAFDLAAKYGFEFWYAAASILQGRARARQGWQSWGCAQMERGLTAWRATGIEVSWQYGAALLAETYLEMGEAARGLRVVNDGLEALVRAGYWWSAELHRLRGELLLQAGAPPREAEKPLHDALAIAREQGARSLELRAATSLARLDRENGKRDEALSHLAEIYGWFREGLDTPDLEEARELLLQREPEPDQAGGK